MKKVILLLCMSALFNASVFSMQLRSGRKTTAQVENELNSAQIWGESYLVKFKIQRDQYQDFCLDYCISRLSDLNKNGQFRIATAEIHSSFKKHLIEDPRILALKCHRTLEEHLKADANF